MYRIDGSFNYIILSDGNIKKKDEFRVDKDFFWLIFPLKNDYMCVWCDLWYRINNI
ncbi:hypothetical protein PIROE2DRAFT_12054 [Piromyces sp. E2]|nr:hypothetical protein PIROE2DRAFT_12054 [Piromyces sp. E2]|eukprot:OUM61850.1 hypothetical protein PIROE2DRAFT_12054 [Piromyces sp. E2]